MFEIRSDLFIIFALIRIKLGQTETSLSYIPLWRAKITVARLGAVRSEEAVPSPVTGEYMVNKTQRSDHI